MKRSKSNIFCIIGGVVCAVCVFLFMNSVQANAKAAELKVLEKYGSDITTALVATRDILPGEEINSSNCEEREWASALLVQGALTSLDDCKGGCAGSPIYTGEVISTQRLNDATASIEVPAGMCAISVGIKDVNALGGHVLPGDTVDVYASGASGTSVISKNTLVLATNTGVSTDASKNSGKIEWVLLSVLPESVEEIITASEKTEIHLTLQAKNQEEGQ